LPLSAQNVAPNVLTDGKARQKRPNKGSTPRRTFESWTTERDVEDLRQWEQVFGEGFKAILTFIYWIDAPLAPEPGMFEHRDRWYWLMGLGPGEDRDHTRRASHK